MQRIAALQAKLDKVSVHNISLAGMTLVSLLNKFFAQEVENNAELKRKLSKLEHRLEEKEEASASERVAMV